MRINIRASRGIRTHDLTLQTAQDHKTPETAWPLALSVLIYLLNICYYYIIRLLVFDVAELR